jgi:hypothetical protein
MMPIVRVAFRKTLVFVATVLVFWVGLCSSNKLGYLVLPTSFVGAQPGMKVFHERYVTPPECADPVVSPLWPDTYFCRSQRGAWYGVGSHTGLRDRLPVLQPSHDLRR